MTEPCVCDTDFTCMASHIADKFERERNEACEAILRVEAFCEQMESDRFWLQYGGPKIAARIRAEVKPRARDSERCPVCRHWVWVEGGVLNHHTWVGSVCSGSGQESNIGHLKGTSVAHQIPRGAERSQEIATDPDRSQLDGPSETRSD